MERQRSLRAVAEASDVLSQPPLAQAGASLLVTYNTDEKAAAELQSEVKAGGGRAFIARFDAFAQGGEERLAAEAEERLGHIDILVNNAGMLVRTPFVDIEASEFDKIVHGNLRSPFLLTQAVARRMIKRGNGGSIVNVSSISAHTPPPTDCRTTSARRPGFLPSPRVPPWSWGTHNIRVNAIEPGLVATDINRAQWAEDPEVWKARCAPHSPWPSRFTLRLCTAGGFPGIGLGGVDYGFMFCRRWWADA